MIPLLTLILTPVAAPAELPAMVPLVFMQEDELKEEFKRFDEILKSKTDEGEAINMMDGFVGRYRTAETRVEAIDLMIAIEEGDKKSLLNERKALRKLQNTLAAKVYTAITHKRRKAVTEANMQMWKAAAYSLGQMGSSGAHFLWKAFELKKLNDEPDLRGLCLEQIGYTHAYEDFAEELINLLDHHEYLFIAKASDALAQFGAAPGSIRQAAVEKLVKQLSQNWEATISDKSDEESQRKYRKTGQAMRDALEALTGTSQDNPQEWNTWWNENKKDKDLWADD